MEIRIEDIDMENARIVYFVYGVVPEFMPHTAFRREKHFETAGKKIIKCPYCRHTFATVDENERVELRCLSEKAEVIYHNFMPCKTCRHFVAIMLITLCARCASQFYNSPEHIIRRTNPNQKYKDTCCYCGCRSGWDYSVQRRAKSR